MSALDCMVRSILETIQNSLNAYTWISTQDKKYGLGYIISAQTKEKYPGNLHIMSHSLLNFRTKDENKHVEIMTFSRPFDLFLSGFLHLFSFPAWDKFMER